MALFYGWGSTASRLQPLRGGSLLFTIPCVLFKRTSYIAKKKWLNLCKTIPTNEIFLVLRQSTRPTTKNVVPEFLLVAKLVPHWFWATRIINHLTTFFRARFFLEKWKDFQDSLVRCFFFFFFWCVSLNVLNVTSSVFSKKSQVTLFK